MRNQVDVPNLPPDYDHETGLRLKRVRAKLGLTGEEMAAAVDVTRGYWSSLENCKAAPGRKLLSTLERVFRVRKDYVVAGVNPMFDYSNEDESTSGHEGQLMDPGKGSGAWYLDGREHTLRLVVSEGDAPAWMGPLGAARATAHSRGPLPEPPGLDVTEGALLPVPAARVVRPLRLSLPPGEGGGQGKDYELIPRHLSPVSAGHGSAVAASGREKVDLAGDVAFSYRWLQQNLRHTTGHLTTIEVRGNSMATTLLDGDTIMIDEGVSSIEVDDIYVIEVHGRRIIKRVQHLADGTLVLISDNQSYQRETIPRDQARDVRVIGRMVWPRVR